VLLGFARNVLKEYRDDDELSRAEEISGSELGPIMTTSRVDQTEIRDRCLAKCLMELPEQGFLLEYHSYEAGGKVVHRKAMAEKRRWTLNALRLKASRLKSAVEECVKRCCQSGGAIMVQ
jgi:hypothetical protein